MKDGLWEDLKLRKLTDGLNEVKVSKGVLDCLDMRHHLDEGQFWTTTDALTFLLAGACRRKVERAELVGIF